MQSPNSRDDKTYELAQAILLFVVARAVFTIPMRGLGFVATGAHFLARTWRLLPSAFCFRWRYPCKHIAKRTTTSLCAGIAPHQPVLVDHVLEHFRDAQLDVFVDCTVGAGGHASALLSSIQIGRYIAMDKDTSALCIAKRHLQSFNNVEYIHSDFRDLSNVLHAHNVLERSVNGILLDLGVSSMQLDDGERGFSFMRDGPLDMRMDTSSGGVTAADIVNTFTHEKLREIFRNFGEDPRAALHASRVVQARQVSPIRTTAQLAHAIYPGGGRRRIHPATLPFQALRIAVNSELQALDNVLPSVVNCLKPRGRAAIISFHSLEDRLVKQAFRKCEVQGGVDVLTRKPLVATRDEVQRNARSRSAKLRVVQKLERTQMPCRVKINKYKDRNGYNRGVEA